MRRFALFLLIVLLGVRVAGAFEPFKVTDIRVEGLRRISPGTVFNYLPVRVGDELDESKAAQAIRSLYATGFFQDVKLQREGDVLVVSVVERPSVAKIEFHGNDALPTDSLKEALKSAGLQEGQVYNRSLLENIRKELRRQYFSRGKYNVDIQTTVSPLPRNRVAIRIDIKEGENAKIATVHIVGNKAFDESELLDQFELGPGVWYLPFSSRDEYSREKLSADLESLRSFYLNRGFINFTITSTQVSISPDRQHIFVTVNVAEGKQYKVKEVKLAGELVVPRDELRKLIAVEPGELYTEKSVTKTSEALRERLGEEGYAFANVNPVPDVDKDKQEVTLTFYLDPGKRAYVRHVNISGNYRTKDDVIRREIRQMEGGWFSSDKVKLSKTRLERLGFFKDVSVETPRVPGSPDQLDVDFKVKEGLSGNLQIGVGYGTDNGVIFNFAVQQDNILGTGDRVDLAANRSKADTLAKLSYLERYYTVDGVSRSYSLIFHRRDATQLNLADYGTTSITGQVGFGFPLNEEDTIHTAIGYEDLRLRLGDRSTQAQRDFVDQNGDRYKSGKLTISWSHNSQDRRIFPTSGGSQKLSLETDIPGSDLEYYRVSYSNRYYFPLGGQWAFELKGGLGYGEGYGKTGKLPFFENFYAGGVSSVRGYRGSSLGPRDENNDPIGGNAKVVGTLAVVFPVPGVDLDSVRLTTFVDGGNVYDTTQGNIDLGQLRYSAGIGATWLSPLGALTVSLARPLNAQSGDRRQQFQFSLGSFF